MAIFWVPYKINFLPHDFLGFLSLFSPITIELQKLLPYQEGLHLGRYG
jgi:hypothetical protein